MTDTYFLETLPLFTAQLAEIIKKSPPLFLESFYLSGGTALSLQIGHRESEDLDFFSREPFNPLKIQQQLTGFGKLTDVEIAAGTLNAYLNGVKLQFLEYPFDLIEQCPNWEGVNLSSVLDIGCTKLQTVGMRGSKKDLIDVYFLLEVFSLTELFNAMQKKYKNIEYSQTHILKSLVYFADAELQPLPKMHKVVEWNEVKKKLVETVRQVSLS